MQAFDALDSIAETGLDADLLALLTRCENAARRLDRTAVSAVAALERRGVFAEKGYKSSAAALADLLGWERFEARRRVVAAEQVTAAGRTGRLRAAGAAACHRRNVRGRAGEPATRRRDRARARHALRATTHARAVGGCRVRAGGQDRRLHPLRAAGLGCRAGRGARPGRRRARRSATGAGQRAAPDPDGDRRRQNQGPDRRRRDVRRDRHGDRREGEAADRRRRAPGRTATGRGAGRRVRLRPRPRRRVPGAAATGRT